MNRVCNTAQASSGRRQPSHVCVCVRVSDAYCLKAAPTTLSSSIEEVKYGRGSIQVRRASRTSRVHSSASGHIFLSQQAYHPWRSFHSSSKTVWGSEAYGNFGQGLWKRIRASWGIGSGEWVDGLNVTNMIDLDGSHMLYYDACYVPVRCGVLSVCRLDSMRTMPDAFCG